MGRVFEKRKHRIFARNAKLSKLFSRIGKEIAMAVKSGGPSPDSNHRLKVAIQNAKGMNMPKDIIDRAIKKAAGGNEADFSEVNYEGYAPGGVAIFVETATNNPTRTVANIRKPSSLRSGRQRGCPERTCSMYSSSPVDLGSSEMSFKQSL